MADQVNRNPQQGSNFNKDSVGNKSMPSQGTGNQSKTAGTSSPQQNQQQRNQKGIDSDMKRSSSDNLDE